MRVDLQAEELCLSCLEEQKDKHEVRDGRPTHSGQVPAGTETLALR
jgi:hypothetical protein